MERTSNGDGILRTQDDINRYWSYLESYTPEGGQTKYLDKTSKDDLRPGMLAYQDLGGEMVNGVQQGPNGQIVLEQDYGKLCEKNKTYNVSTRLGAPVGKDLLSVPISLLHGVEYAL
ncbi:hypothetical protein NXY28_11895 [Bacteroides thetaiotaomicron]|nr:hypothetical protein NXY28_11895 [Bacteroides thetaiotaomicron]